MKKENDEKCVNFANFAYGNIFSGFMCCTMYIHYHIVSPFSLAGRAEDPGKFYPDPDPTL